MVDIVVTAATTVPGTDGSQLIGTGIAGETIVAGQVLYLDPVTNTLKLADANASAVTAQIKGISVSGGAAGQRVSYQYGGLITIGGTLTAGKIIVLTATPGGMALAADLASGWYTSILGVAQTAAIMRINIVNSGFVS